MLGLKGIEGLLGRVIVSIMQYSWGLKKVLSSHSGQLDFFSCHHIFFLFMLTVRLSLQPWVSRSRLEMEPNAHLADEESPGKLSSSK